MRWFKMLFAFRTPLTNPLLYAAHGVYEIVMRMIEGEEEDNLSINNRTIREIFRLKIIVCL